MVRGSDESSRDSSVMHSLKSDLQGRVLLGQSFSRAEFQSEEIQSIIERFIIFLFGFGVKTGPSPSGKRSSGGDFEVSKRRRQWNPDGVSGKW